ncbi:MAG: hypothetical protein WBK77_09215 [Alphaproteobacteria bacterium]
MRKKEKLKRGVRSPVVLERSNRDGLLPKNFGEIIWRRFSPVLSLTYISAVIGIAGVRGDFYHYLFMDKTAYTMGLFVALWVSIPAVIWILMKANPVCSHVANLWYKIISALMILLLVASFILFPETGLYGGRVYLAASLPVFLVMYLLFVKGGLPGFMAHALTAFGLTALIHGAILQFIH